MTGTTERMDLFYDERDDASHEARGSQILYWLDDLGAKPLAEARPRDRGFVFAIARPIEDYQRLFSAHPLVRDRPKAVAARLRGESGPAPAGPVGALFRKVS